MGNGSWGFEHFESVRSERVSKPVEAVFTSRTMAPEMDPAKMVVRESRDSAEHPESTAIILGFDVTGSMGQIPEAFARGLLGGLMRELLEKRPVPDPQLLVVAVGDSTCDRYPLQVGQFESDMRIDDWLTKIYIEGGGGGGNHESYGLVHHFAGTRTSIDCMEERGRKGFLFTVGDEAPWEVIRKAEIAKVFGDAQAEDVTLEAAIASAQRLYDVIHILVKSQNYAPSENLAIWQKYLGQNVLVLDDYTHLAELVVTTIAVRHGMSLAAATHGFSGAANAMVLRSGVAALARAPGGDLATL